MGVYIAGKQVSNGANNYAVKRNAIRAYPDIYHEENLAPGTETGFQYFVSSWSDSGTYNVVTWTINKTDIKLYTDETCITEVNEEINDVSNLKILNAKVYYIKSDSSYIGYALPIEQQDVISYSIELTDTQIIIKATVNSVYTGSNKPATILFGGMSGILMYKNYIIAGTSNSYVNTDIGSSATEQQDFSVPSANTDGMNILRPNQLKLNKGPNIKSTLTTGDTLTIPTASSDVNIAYIEYVFAPYNSSNTTFTVKDIEGDAYLDENN